MKRLPSLAKPHVLFFVTGLLFLIISTLQGKDTLDISVHDTYFVISWWHIGLAMCLLYSIQALSYFLLRNSLNRRYSALHYLLQLPLVLGLLFLQVAPPETNHYYPGMTTQVSGQQNLAATCVMPVALFLVLAQILFLMAVIRALVKRIRS